MLAFFIRSFQSSSYPVVCMRLGGPLPDLSHFWNCGSVGNQTHNLLVCSLTRWPFGQWGSHNDECKKQRFKSRSLKRFILKHWRPELFSPFYYIIHFLYVICVWLWIFSLLYLFIMMFLRIYYRTFISVLSNI